MTYDWPGLHLKELSENIHIAVFYPICDVEVKWLTCPPDESRHSMLELCERGA